MEQIRLSHNEAKLVSVNSKGEIEYSAPGMWRCHKCGSDIFSVEDPPVFCDSCKRKSTFDNITPSIFKEPWRPYGEPLIYDSLDCLFENICGFIGDHLVLRNDVEKMVLALWIIASYRQQDFFTAPYLQFLGAIESGKTRALTVLYMLAYRAVNHIAISPAALCRRVAVFHPTVLLDQAEQKFDLRRERGCEMYDIFMSGYQKGQEYVVADREDPLRTISKDVFGFKAVASTRVFDDAFTSRSIIFRMRLGIPKVKDITEVSYRRADELRNMLLYFHLKDEPLPLTDPLLVGRRRELFLPLLRAGVPFEITEEDLSDYLKVDRSIISDELSDSQEADILREIKIMQDAIDVTDRIRIAEIAMRLDVKPVVVGHRLKNMNIPRAHGRDGAFIDFNDKKTVTELKYLYSKYHVEVF